MKFSHRFTERLKVYLTNSWVISNPFIAARVLRGIIRARIFGKKSAKVIEIYPTMRCQSKCVMCSTKQYHERKSEILSLDDYRRIAKEGRKLGAIAISILGGEPLLSKDLREIVRIFRDQHYYVSMNTNALLLTEDLLEHLKQDGLRSIYFSLESFDEKTNDEVRGYPGHYKKVMQSIAWAKKACLRCGLCPVAFPGHLDRFEEVIRYCQDHGMQASGGQLSAVGEATGAEILSPEENNRVRAMLTKYNRLTFDWAMSYSFRYQCPAGGEKFGITSTGDVIGCSVNPIAWGNVKRESLGTIFSRMNGFSQFSKNSPVCLTAEDKGYLKTYIDVIPKDAPVPIPYVRHPNITPEKEPLVYRYEPHSAGGESDCTD